jgi:Ser/Thr protein kinase RdoA (MazF antagonist)
MTESPHPFQTLTPSFIMDAVESQGFVCDCRTFALNSYENRVYQVGIEEGQPLIAKFYRPGRWSNAQIMEEHLFCRELADQELSVVAPWRNGAGESLFHHGVFRFALYPRQGGHAPEFDNLDNLLILGRMLGRIHGVGSVRPFAHRPVLDPQSFGHASVALIGQRFMPEEYRPSYAAVTDQLLAAIDECLAEAGPVRQIRTHGDCHAGNILWRDGVPHFVDFDDARMAPAVQDLWMMLSGDRLRQTAQLDALLEGYREFYDFDPRELRLIEALRALRMLHYAAWLASRWEDPMFPGTFPWFNTVRYWGEHILQLREQLAALDEPPLELP